MTLQAAKERIFFCFPSHIEKKKKKSFVSLHTHSGKYISIQLFFFSLCSLLGITSFPREQVDFWLVFLLFLRLPSWTDQKNEGKCYQSPLFLLVPLKDAVTWMYSHSQHSVHLLIFLPTEKRSWAGGIRNPPPIAHCSLEQSRTRIWLSISIAAWFGPSSPKLQGLKERFVLGCCEGCYLGKLP